MRKTLDFQAPTACWGNDSFETCFHAAAMYIDGRMIEGVRRCGQTKTDICGHCGLGQLYWTMLGWPFTRYAYGGPADKTRRYFDVFNQMGNRPKLLFGYAGYNYNICTDSAKFKAELTASIDAGRPVIAEITDEAYERNRTEFQLIIGYDGDELITPQYRLGKPDEGMGLPYGSLAYNDIHALYIFGDKITPQFTFVDILKRNRAMVQANLEEKVWDKYLKEIELKFIKQEGSGEDRAYVFGEIKKAAGRHMSSWDFGATHNDGLFAELHKGQFDTLTEAAQTLYNQIYEQIWKNNCEGMDIGHFVNHCHNCMNVINGGCHFIYFGKMLISIIERYRELDTELLDLLNQLIGVFE